ncbi:hypothetical protein [Serratia marcescens]
MRKACIELSSSAKAACLLAGDLGMGRCLFMVVISDDMSKEPSPEQWARALQRCKEKAVELKYEVSRIRGERLAGL